jgi:hypothetical protein
MISSKHTIKEALEIAKSKKVYIEGNFTKLFIDTSDKDVKSYIDLSKEKDLENRKKRLQITKQVQKQNKDLESAAKENEKLVVDLKKALKETEIAKGFAEDSMDKALQDLAVVQKKSQFELIGTIVRVALWVIGGVGILTSLMYAVALMNDVDTQIIGSTWSNMLGILLTNAFSIVGTIMGVKYATDNTKE